MQDSLTPILAVLATSIILFAARGCESVGCAEVGATTQRKTEFHMLSGCYVEVNGRMVPLDSWRGEQE